MLVGIDAILGVYALPAILGEGGEDLLVGAVQPLAGQVVVPVQFDALQVRFVVGSSVEDDQGALPQELAHLAVGGAHVRLVVDVPRFDHDTERDVVGWRQLRTNG